MALRKRKSGYLCNDEDDATWSSERTQEIEIIGHWTPIDLANESFNLPHTVDADRYPTFNLRTVSFLKIFLRFVTVSLVTKIAQDIDPADLRYDCGAVILLSLCSIYKPLAIWIRIYGEQHAPNGVIRHSRPLREQLIWYWDHFRDCYPRIDSLGIRFMEIVTTKFLFDSWLVLSWWSCKRRACKEESKILELRTHSASKHSLVKFVKVSISEDSGMECGINSVKNS